MTKSHYLGLIQEVIGRMGTRSTLFKVFAFIACFGRLFMGRMHSFGTAAYYPIGLFLCFWILDAFYLRVERAYIRLYNEAARNQAPPSYSLSPNDPHQGCLLSFMATPHLAIYYLVLIIVSV